MVRARDQTSFSSTGSLVRLVSPAREVHRRSDKTIHAGERVKIRKLEPRESKSNAGRSYTDYRSTFLDGPESSQADILGPPPEATAEPQPQAESTVDPDAGHDIPF